MTRYAPIEIDKARLLTNAQEAALLAGRSMVELLRPKWVPVLVAPAVSNVSRAGFEGLGQEMLGRLAVTTA